MRLICINEKVDFDFWFLKSSGSHWDERGWEEKLIKGDESAPPETSTENWCTWVTPSPSRLIWRSEVFNNCMVFMVWKTQNLSSPLLVSSHFFICSRPLQFQFRSLPTDFRNHLKCFGWFCFFQPHSQWAEYENEGSSTRDSRRCSSVHNAPRRRGLTTCLRQISAIKGCITEPMLRIISYIVTNELQVHAGRTERMSEKNLKAEKVQKITEQ